MFTCDYYKFTTVSNSERILKIDQHFDKVTDKSIVSCSFSD